MTSSGLCHAAPQDCVGEFLTALDELGLPHCALHAHGGFLYQFDIAVDPSCVNQVMSVARRILKPKLIRNEQRGRRLGVLFERSPATSGTNEKLVLVLRESFPLDGHTNVKELLENRKRECGFWVPPAELQLKRLMFESLFSSVSASHVAHIRSLLQQDDERIRAVGQELFGAQVIAELHRGVLSEDLSRHARRRIAFRHPLTAARSSVGNCAESLRQFFSPEGFFCVILGPDGVGKSTTIEHFRSALEIVFGRCHTRRWRPAAIRRISPGRPDKMPHSGVQRGKLASAAYIVGLMLDFTIGYLTRLLPLLARSEAVVFDRYFHDMLVDSRRYRYAGPRWLVSLGASLVPPRGATFVVLDAREEVVLARKKELAPEELCRQRLAYAEFALSHERSLLIDTNGTVRETVEKLTKQIFRRVQSENPEWSAYVAEDRNTAPPRIQIVSPASPDADLLPIANANASKALEDGL
jgi:thymidylate kinase